MGVAIVFCDMDGTFLASDKSVPKEHLDLLDLLAERGISFVPCTGRPASAVPEVVRAHDACRHVVASNGAVVEETGHGRIMERTLANEVVLDLYEKVQGLSVTFDVFCGGEVYSERSRYEAMGTYDIAPATLSMLRQVRRPTDLMVPEVLRRFGPAEKVTCFWKGESDRAGLETILEGMDGLSYAQGDPKDFEMQAEGVSKGETLVWLCEHLSIPVEDSVAFGDEGNDRSLLQAAGLGVAMDNATAEVRAVADAIAPANDEAGVARFMRGLLGL